MTAALLAAALSLYALTLVLLVADVWTAPGLSRRARAGWIAALALASFFVVVLWFAQGRTGRFGRAGSVVLVVAIALSIGVIVVEAARII